MIEKDWTNEDFLRFKAGLKRIQEEYEEENRKIENEALIRRAELVANYGADE